MFDFDYRNLYTFLFLDQMNSFSKPQYWEERYESEKDKTYEWLESWKDLKYMIEKHGVKGLYTDDQYVDYETA